VTDQDKFQAWAHEVMCAMIDAGRSAVGPASPMIDAGIAYRLGYTPAQAAHAILGLDRKAYCRLCDLSVHPEKNRERHEDRPQ
jgi:hypothetical protein